MKQAIFITGGSTGIGFELAKLYATLGYQVGICARSSSKLPENFLLTYPNVHFYEVDVTQKPQVHSAINAFIKQRGQLDILIANAGRSTGSKQQVPDFDTVEDIINTNVHGVLYAIGAALPTFLQQKHGQIVIIGSVAGLVGLPGAAAYSASKAAVMTLGESLAIDLPRYGIDVTVIAPGFIDTPLTQKNDHKMPFIMPAETAVQKIYRAIKKRKALYIFPWQMRLFMSFPRLMPRAWYRFMMRGKFFNYSRGL